MKKKINIGILIFRIISLIIILICLYLLFNWSKENNKNKNLSENLASEIITENYVVTPTLPENTETTDNTTNNTEIQIAKTDFSKLLSQNQDTVGWIMINNTNINFPIVKSTDNKYYLKHNFNKEYNSAGWIYADYRNNFENLDKHTIVYGHNRRNGTMFSNLQNYLDKNWNSDSSHKYFSFNTINQNYIAEIFSAYKISSNVLTVSNTFTDEDEHISFLENCKKLSVSDFGTEVTTSDNILTLCTCDNNTAYRIVIHAKLTPVN